MKKYVLRYMHKTAFNHWVEREVETSDPMEYQRWVNVVHENKSEYIIIDAYIER